jgi:hypothetical protein
VSYTEQNPGGTNVTLKLWHAVLIAVLSVALAAPARAESLQTAGRQVEVGIIVAPVAVAVVVTLLILHYKHKRGAITGCVTSGAIGMSVTDEKDKRIYAVSGDPVGVKPGERMTLEGKRKQSGKTLVFEAHSVTKDFGACQP